MADDTGAMRTVLVSAVLAALVGFAVRGPVRTHVLGYALGRMDDRDAVGALRWLDRADAIGADPATVAGMRGDAHVMLGHSAAALAAYNAAAALPGVTPGALIGRARLVLDLRADTTGLAAHLDAALAGGRDPEALLVRARYRRLAGDDTRALADLDAALDRVPRWPVAMDERAQLLLGMGRDAEAQAAFKTLAVLHPDNPLGHVGLASFHASRGDWQAVVVPAEALVRLAPRRVWDRLGAAGAHHCAGHADGVREHLDAYVALGGDLGEVDPALVAVYQGDPSRLGEGCTQAAE